jgi:hypothetical protein
MLRGVAADGAALAGLAIIGAGQPTLAAWFVLLAISDL